MKESVSNSNLVTLMLFLYEPEQYLQQVWEIIREEVSNVEKQRPFFPTYETPGLTYKPLYKIAEVCALLHATQPTIYDWVRHGKLKPFKFGYKCTFCGKIYSSFLTLARNNSERIFLFSPAYCVND